MLETMTRSPGGGAICPAGFNATERPQHVLICGGHMNKGQITKDPQLGDRQFFLLIGVSDQEVLKDARGQLQANLVLLAVWSAVMHHIKRLYLLRFDQNGYLKIRLDTLCLLHYIHSTPRYTILRRINWAQELQKSEEIRVRYSCGRKEFNTGFSNKEQ